MLRPTADGPTLGTSPTHVCPTHKTLTTKWTSSRRASACNEREHTHIIDTRVERHRIQMRFPRMTGRAAALTPHMWTPPADTTAGCRYLEEYCFTFTVVSTWSWTVTEWYASPAPPDADRCSPHSTFKHCGSADLPPPRTGLQLYPDDPSPPRYCRPLTLGPLGKPKKELNIKNINRSDKSQRYRSQRKQRNSRVHINVVLV